MVKDFTNKVAAITGAGSGIGQELALELARRGCHLALCCDRNVEGLQETADQARAVGVNVTSQRLDVSNRNEVYAWADQVVKDHGKANLIFNNAGVDLVSSIEGIKYEDFEWLMNINFWGVVYGTKAFLPYLKAAGEGHIVNVSSVFGLFSVPAQGAYNSAKFALRGFSDCLREELDIMNCGVSATSVHPGGIKTRIARSGRIDSNIRSLGFNEQDYYEKFEQVFITQADKAARGIIRAVEKNKRRALIGPDAYAYDLLVRLLPASYQPLIIRFVKRVMG
jgi:NAD(P)-dependent dehydrogenase (short-subunit alcohol dehydrogenase family)